MRKGTCCYAKYGERVAWLTLVPGWGQLRNKQYIKAILVAATLLILLFATVELSLLEITANQASLSGSRWTLLLLALVVWEASLFDAYYRAIERRRKDAQRYSVELGAKVTGFDSGGKPFYENAMTKNLSKVGACLALPREVPANSQLTVEFRGKAQTRARVIWSRPKGIGTNALVGVEFLQPIEVL
jgi:PilZ domain